MSRLHTPADIRRLLREHGVAPRKARGQNFVIDANTVRKVVRDAGVEAGELVCEVGPGLGSLTLALRERAALVVAIEVDPGLVRALTDVVGDDEGVRVVQADALQVDFAAIVEQAAVVFGLGSEVRPALVANLPYNVATPLVLRALETGTFGRLLVMVQREVGERWAAQPGSRGYSGVSVKIAALAQATLVGRVSRSAFYPVPNVDSVTVRLVPRPPPPQRERLFALVEQGFGQRRKRLRNALAGPDRPPEVVEAALRGAGLSPGARAEELHLGNWEALARTLPP